MAGHRQQHASSYGRAPAGNEASSSANQHFNTTGSSAAAATSPNPTKAEAPCSGSSASEAAATVSAAAHGITAAADGLQPSDGAASSSKQDDDLQGSNVGGSSSSQGAGSEATACRSVPCLHVYGYGHASEAPESDGRYCFRVLRPGSVVLLGQPAVQPVTQQAAAELLSRCVVS